MLEARLLREAGERYAQFKALSNSRRRLPHVALDGRWLRVNQRICDITGYSREELLASRFQDITHPDDLAADLLQYQALQRGETQSYQSKSAIFTRPVPSSGLTSQSLFCETTQVRRDTPFQSSKTSPSARTLPVSSRKVTASPNSASARLKPFTRKPQSVFCSSIKICALCGLTSI